MISRSIRVAVFVLGCAILLWLSLAPGDGLPLASVWDKAKHSAAYAVLMLAGAAAVPRRIVVVAAVLLGLGVLIEFIQASMPFGRQGDILDVAANSVGLAVGATIALAIREWIKVKSRAQGE